MQVGRNNATVKIAMIAAVIEMWFVAIMQELSLLVMPAIDCETF